MPSRPRHESLDSTNTRVVAWGAGEDGQLGLSDLLDKRWASGVDSLGDVTVKGVVAGSRNSLALSEDGKLYTWGWNQRGTLGHAPVQKFESTPSQVMALADVRIVQAAIGGWHCLAVDNQGRAYAWGGNEYGQCAEEAECKLMRRDIPLPQRCAPNLRVRQVAAGGTHSVVLTEEGFVWSWGQPWPPGDIKQIARPVRVQGLESVRHIAVGAFHNLALLESGKVWAWGNNEYGQLGTGDTQPHALPVPVKKLSGLDVVDIAAGGWHSVALTDTRKVYGWGRGEHGRLGFGEDKSSKMVPQQVHLLADETIVQISCGGTHSVALTEDGRMLSFGRGDHGRLGDGRHITTGHPQVVPVNLPWSEENLSDGKEDGNLSDGIEDGNLSDGIEDGVDHESVPSTRSDGFWRVKVVACGGQHTLAIVRWDSHTKHK